MKKFIITFILAVVAIAALAWALSYKSSGLAWFPGFCIAVFCAMKIMDVYGVGQEKKKETAHKCGPGC